MFFHVVPPHRKPVGKSHTQPKALRPGVAYALLSRALAMATTFYAPKRDRKRSTRSDLLGPSARRDHEVFDRVVDHL